MSEKLSDVWEPRDFPVLREACRLIDQDERANATDLVRVTGLTPFEVQLAIKSLRRTGHITHVDDRGEMVVAVDNVSGHAYRIVGLHPDPDRDLPELLVERLLAAADATSDDEEKTKLQRAASLFKEISKSVTSSVLSATINAALAR